MVAAIVVVVKVVIHLGGKSVKSDSSKCCTRSTVYLSRSDCLAEGITADYAYWVHWGI